MTRKSENTGRQQKPHLFKPGQSGNPDGRPKGARNKTTLAVEALLDGEGEALTRKAIELAKAGDMQALRLCIERIVPARKDSPVAFELPEMKTAGDAVTAFGSIVAAVGSGDLTPGEAQVISALLQNFAKTIETAELEQRIAALEKAAPK